LAKHGQTREKLGNREQINDMDHLGVLFLGIVRQLAGDTSGARTARTTKNKTGDLGTATQAHPNQGPSNPDGPRILGLAVSPRIGGQMHVSTLLKLERPILSIV
jgi:hypothetical protein